MLYLSRLMFVKGNCFLRLPAACFALFALSFTLSASVLKQVGKWGADPFYGPALSVDVADNLAFVGCDPAGLLVFDVSNPSAPRLLSIYSDAGPAYAVKVRGSFAYVAFFMRGLVILDISDPLNLKPVGSLSFSGVPAAIDLEGDLVVVAVSFDRTRLIDISDPTQPSLLSTFGIMQPHSVQLEGNRMYVTERPALSVFDISNPAMPTRLVHNIRAQGTGLIARGADLFLAYNNFTILNAANLIIPVTKGSLDSGWPDSRFESLALNETATLAVAGGSSQLWVIDISNTSSPQTHAIIQCEAIQRALRLQGNICFLADGPGGFKIYDLSNPSSPRLLSNFRTSEDVRRVIFRGDRAWVANGSLGVALLDISDPFTPKLLQRFDTPGIATSLDVLNDIVFVADHRRGLQVLDFRDLQNPSTLSSFDTPGFAESVQVHNGVAYLTDQREILAFDISNPAELPAPRSSPVKGANDLLISGNTLYAGYSPLYIFDISNPSEFRLLGTFETGGQIIGFRDGLLFTSTLPLHILNVRDPANVELLSTLPHNTVWLGEGDLLANFAIFTWEYGMKVVNISDPAMPQIVQEVSDLLYPYSVTANPPYAWILTGTTGAFIYQLQPPQPRLSWTWQSNNLLLEASSADGRPLTLETTSSWTLQSSTDLTSWEPVSTTPTLLNGKLQFPNLLTPTSTFFRISTQ